MRITRGSNLAAAALFCALALASACTQQQPPKSAATDLQQAPPPKDAAVDRTVLPPPEQPFAGKIGRTTKDSVKDFPKMIEAPKGAPNILVILTDDVGFGASARSAARSRLRPSTGWPTHGLRYNHVPHHGALLAHARGAPHRPQSSQRQHRRHHGVGARASPATTR